MFIQRDLVPEINQWLNREKIIILNGSRQVGKTTILKYLEQKLKKGNPTLFYTIDMEIGNPLFKEPRLFIKFLESHIVSGKRLYIFLDEFQYLKDAGLFVKVVFDKLKEHIQLIISGSSSLEISKNREFLTGRKIEFQLTPFSFREYARVTNSIKNIGKNDYINLENMDEIRDFYLIHHDKLTTAVIDYLNWGGYPKPSFESGEKRETILREIIGTYLQKDIAGFLKISKIDAYNNLLRLMTSQIGNLVNKSELKQTLGLNMETINKYLNMLKGTYVFHLISPYFTNLRKEISKMQKAYIADPGLSRIILNSTLHHTPDSFQGNEIENFVYIHAKKLKGINAINYYRTISKAEIDFILHTQEVMIPMEVKYRRGKQQIPLEMKNFSERYPERVGKKIIITRDYLYRDGDCYFIPYLVFPFVQVC